MYMLRYVLHRKTYRTARWQLEPRYTAVWMIVSDTHYCSYRDFVLE